MLRFCFRPYGLLLFIVLSVIVAPVVATTAPAAVDTTPLLELVPQTGHADEVTTLSFSPDGKVLATGSRDGTIKLWDTKTGVVSRTLIERSGAVRVVAFAPDGETLASTGGNDLSIN